MTRNYSRIICLLVFSTAIFILSPGTVFSQTKSKIAKLMELNRPDNHSHNFSSYLKNSNNELEATAAILFIGYKNFFSSQDMSSCVFTPSCSVYAIESLQHDNLLKAYLKIFDRLARCHPFVRQGEYTFNMQTQRYYDPAY